MTLREVFTWLVDIPYLGTFLLWTVLGMFGMTIGGGIIGSIISWRERRKYMNWRPRE